MKQKRHIALKMKALHLKTRNEAWIFLTGFRSSLCLCLACSRSALLCCLLLKGSSPGKPQAHKSALRAMGPAVGVTEGDEGMAQPPAGKHSTRHKPTPRDPGVCILRWLTLALCSGAAPCAEDLWEPLPCSVLLITLLL